jgi:hypothetical protein
MIYKNTINLEYYGKSDDWMTDLEKALERHDE